MGQIGLVSNETQDVRMAYVVKPGAKDAGFAETAYQQLRNPVTVQLIEPAEKE
jgi:hypothetical protein